MYVLTGVVSGWSRTSVSTMTTNRAPGRYFLAAGVLAFLALATRELVNAGVHQTLVYSRNGGTPDDVSSQFDPQVRLVEIHSASERGQWAFLRALRQALRSELSTHHYAR